MENRTYRNIFAECGYSEEEINQRVEDTFQELFYGKDRIYFETGQKMGYLYIYIHAF